MRTDATIDKVQVRCPNASTLGFGKWKAQVGDLVQWNENGQLRIGRMIGRIHYAPAIGDQEPVIRDWIICACLDQFLSYVCERWVNPVDVVRVESIAAHNDQRKIMEWFLSDQMVKEPLTEVRYCVSELWSSLDAYREWRESTKRKTA